jgi:hypothetical protein
MQVAARPSSRDHAMSKVGRVLMLAGRLLLFLFLTLLTEVGGVAYLVGAAVGRVRRNHTSFCSRKITPSLVGLGVYLAMTLVAVPPLAQALGRVRLACGTVSDGRVVAATWLTCALNRGYVTPELWHLLDELGLAVSHRFPGSKLTMLEGNFPFINGFPLLPHLSHRDGKEADLAFFYRRAADGAIIPNGSPSWVGYFIYERPGLSERSACAGLWTPLRWNFAWFQPAKLEWVLDEERTAWMLRWLKARSAVTRIFVEPYLAQRLNVSGGKVHFQGCHAARHDDHVHIEVQ